MVIGIILTKCSFYYQVAVFSPSRSVHYLNVTLNNVVKVHVSGL